MRSEQHPMPDSTAGFPRGGSADEIWRFLVRYAIRAPSGHNTQPWRFCIVDGRLRVYADRLRRLPVVDPDDRELVISCGAALAHLVVAMRHFGSAGRVTPFPDPGDPDLLATAELGEAHAPRPGDHDLFEAIDNRHTHRSEFDARPIPPRILAQLTRDASRAGATLHPVTSSEQKDAIATLVAKGDRAQFDDREFRRELAAWVRPNRTRRGDGMPGHAFGLSDLASHLGPTVIATIDTGASQAEQDERLARTAPALLVLGTAGDLPPDWLAAGQAVAVVLLRATAHGLLASFLNQPIELPALRNRLRHRLGEDHPQLLLRIGYPANNRPTPRRAVSDVLVDDPGRLNRWS